MFRLTLKIVAKVARKALLISAAVRGPSTGVHGVQARAATIIRELQKERISVSQEEALGVAREECLGNPENRRKMEELLRATEAVTPVLEALSKALKVEAAP